MHRGVVDGAAVVVEAAASTLRALRDLSCPSFAFATFATFAPFVLPVLAFEVAHELDERLDALFRKRVID
jgi:hypothetical protein